MVIITEIAGGRELEGMHTRRAIDTASKAGDADTADLFTEVSRDIDKLLWLIEAHAQTID